MKPYLLYLILGLTFLPLSLNTYANESGDPIKSVSLSQLVWGKKRAEITGLKRIDNQTKAQSDFTKEYIKPGDPLEIEGVKVEQVRYTFWRDRLYAVTIETEGQKNYAALQNKVTTLINNAAQKKDTNLQSVLLGTKTTVHMDYKNDTHKGQVQLKSNDINRQIQLIKCAPSNVYSAWIKHKRGLSRQ